MYKLTRTNKEAIVSSAFTQDGIPFVTLDINCQAAKDRMYEAQCAFPEEEVVWEEIND